MKIAEQYTMGRNSHYLEGMLNSADFLRYKSIFPLSWGNMLFYSSVWELI